MKKMSIIVGAIVIVVLIGGWWFSHRDKSQTIVISKEAMMANILPVIQIINPTVSVIGPDGKALRQLANGDALTAPLHIQLGPQADAIIVYVDGSSARLSAGTDINLEEGLYDTNTDTITSKISLTAGHVWSKVVALATPQSLWQVETPHAVATVRGTAFDSKVENGKSTFTGSEHTVKIVPIDPDTGKEMDGKDADLNADKQIVLADADMHQIKNGKEKVEAKDFDKTKSADKDWIDQNNKRDAILEDIKKQEGDQKFIRDMMFQESDRMKDPTDNPTDTQKKVDLKVKDDTMPTTTVKRIMPVRAEIRMDVPKSIVEGTTVHYRVVGISADGKELDITREAKVDVVGGIGTITEPGTFVAKIDADKTEYGTVTGALSGEWTDPVTGNTLQFSTSLFDVTIFIEQTTDTRG